MNIKIHARLPSPRVAIIGFESAESEKLAGHVASPFLADDYESLARPWDEIDLVVGSESPESNVVPWGLSMLFLDDQELSGTHLDGYRGVDGWHYITASVTDAVEMHVPESDSEALNGLVNGLVPNMPFPAHHFTGTNLEWNAAFITNQRDQVLAGEYPRGDQAVGWLLPRTGADASTWLRPFLQRINQLNPEIVPNPPPDWLSWDTAEEMGLKQRRDEIEARFDQATAEFRSEMTAVGEAIEQATMSAGSGHGRLLTSDGDGLKEAVIVALELFGFVVTDADETLADGEGKREDLWVEHRKEIAIVEVKGYTKGASSNDLIRAKDYQVTFVERQGTRPARQWHVVNAYRRADPSSRQRLFMGAEDVVEAFGGLVIDTRDLFKLVRDVESQRLSPENVRDLLWDHQTGFFDYQVHE